MTRKGKGIRKEFNEERLEDKFSFNVSRWDFGGDEEKTKAFMKNMYNLPKYSVYVRDVMIEHFEKQSLGIDEKAISEALALKSKIEKVFGDNFEKILMFGELYSPKELISFIENRGKLNEEQLATQVAQKTAQLMAGMLQGMTFVAPISSTSILPEIVEDDAEIDDFDLD